jgi:DNA-binding NarL/FixJ family response regulator
MTALGGYGERGLRHSVPIRVVVGEDQPLFRDGVVHVLTTAGFDVLAAVGDAEDLVRKGLAHHPDVVVVDIHMPPGFRDDGLRAAQEILAALPATAVLVLSQFLEDRFIIDLLDDRPEGKGYLLKDRIADSDQFVEAVRRVARGGTVIDAEAVGRLVGQRRGGGPIGSLTSREREVLGLMAQGKSNQGIADELVVTVSAVERHVTSIFVRLRLPRDTQEHRRVLAVLQFLRADRSATGTAP